MRAPSRRASRPSRPPGRTGMFQLVHPPTQHPGPRNSATSSITATPAPGRPSAGPGSRARPTPQGELSGADLPPPRGEAAAGSAGSAELAGMAVDERSGRRVQPTPGAAPSEVRYTSHNLEQRGPVEPVQHRRAQPNQPQPSPSVSGQLVRLRAHRSNSPPSHPGTRDRSATTNRASAASTSSNRFGNCPARRGPPDRPPSARPAARL